MVQYNEWDSQGMGEMFTSAEMGENVNVKPLIDAKNEAERVQKLKADIMAQMLRTIERLPVGISDEAFASTIKGFADEIKALTK